jgi:hypothetical protein
MANYRIVRLNETLGVGPRAVAQDLRLIVMAPDRGDAQVTALEMRR